MDQDVAKFNLLMTLLLQTKDADLYRTKCDQGNAKFVFQGIPNQFWSFQILQRIYY